MELTKTFLVRGNSERKVIDHWLQPIDQTQFLTEYSNLHGNVDIVNHLTKNKGVWQESKPSLVKVLGPGMSRYFSSLFSCLDISTVAHKFCW